MALSWVVMELRQKCAFSDHLRWHVAHSETHPKGSGLTGSAPGAPQGMLVDTPDKRDTKTKAQPGFSGTEIPFGHTPACWRDRGPPLPPPHYGHMETKNALGWRGPIRNSIWHFNLQGEEEAPGPAAGGAGYTFKQVPHNRTSLN